MLLEANALCHEAVPSNQSMLECEAYEMIPDWLWRMLDVIQMVAHQ